MNRAAADAADRAGRWRSSQSAEHSPSARNGSGSSGDRGPRVEGELAVASIWKVRRRVRSRRPRAGTAARRRRARPTTGAATRRARDPRAPARGVRRRRASPGRRGRYGRGPRQGVEEMLVADPRRRVVGLRDLHEPGRAVGKRRHPSRRRGLASAGDGAPRHRFGPESAARSLDVVGARAVCGRHDGERTADGSRRAATRPAATIAAHDGDGHGRLGSGRARPRAAARTKGRGPGRGARSGVDGWAPGARRQGHARSARRRATPSPRSSAASSRSCIWWVAPTSPTTMLCGMPTIGSVLRALDAARTAGVRRFLLVSVPGASPETSTPYLRARGLAEEAVTTSGLQHAVIRERTGRGRGLGVVRRGGGRRARIAARRVGDARRGARAGRDRGPRRSARRRRRPRCRAGRHVGLEGPDVVTAGELVDMLAGPAERRRRASRAKPHGSDCRACSVTRSRPIWSRT